MAKTSIQNMTEGNPTRLLLKFSLPMVIGNIFQQLYNMVDSIIVGQFVGPNALAAVGATGSIIFLFFSLAFGLSSGIGIIISQYFGAKDYEKVKKAIATSTYIIVISSLSMGILMMVFARGIMNLLNTPSEIIDDAVLYMQIVGAGMLVVGVYNGVAAILQALGDSKTPLVFLVISCVINIILDLVFVILCKWGVLGVAIATGIAETCSAIGAIIYAWKKIPFFRLSRHEFVVDRTILDKSLNLGVPVAFQSALISLSCVVLQRVVNGYGATIVAAFTAASRFEQLVHQPFNSLGAAIGTYTGQNIGAGKLKRITEGHWAATKLNIIFCLMMVPIAYWGSEAIMRLFTNDIEVIKQGVIGIRITCFFYVALGMIYVSRSVLNGAGDTKFAMVLGISEVVCRVSLAKPLTLVPAIGMLSIWYTTGFTWLAVGVLSTVRYASGKWKTKGVVSLKNTTEAI